MLYILQFIVIVPYSGKNIRYSPTVKHIAITDIIFEEKSILLINARHVGIIIFCLTNIAGGHINDKTRGLTRGISPYCGEMR